MSRAAPELESSGELRPSRRDASVQAESLAVHSEPQRGPHRVLIREDFAPETRDPFARKRERGTSGVPVSVPADGVLFPELSLEDLTLVAVVGLGAGQTGRALFVGPDRRSYTVQQGSSFGREGLRLSYVGRDRIELEGMDPQGHPLERELLLPR